MALKLNRYNSVRTQTFTNQTGDQEEILIDQGAKKTTVFVSAGASDVVNLKGRQKSNGTVRTIQSNISNNFELSNVDASLYSLFINIGTNSSNDIKFEVSATF